MLTIEVGSSAGFPESASFPDWPYWRAEAVTVWLYGLKLL